jgi:hypothetical protein
VLSEEIAQPLRDSGTPLLSLPARTTLPARELLAMRAPQGGSIERASLADEAEEVPGARAER